MYMGADPLTGRKTPEDIKNLHEGAVILTTILQELKNLTKVGKNCKDLDAWVAKQIVARGAGISYHEPDVNFPGAICISVNDALVHGVPPDYVLRDGDKVSYDLTITYGTMHVDSAFTMIVGTSSAMQRKLLAKTEESLYAGIREATRGHKIRDISAAIEKVLADAGLGIIREYTGHGIGAKMHMPGPSIPNFVCPDGDADYVLQVGDTICIEPMACLGKERTFVGEDGWTVYMKDGSLPAHFEHTILITETGQEILTKWK